MKGCGCSTHKTRDKIYIGKANKTSVLIDIFGSNLQIGLIRIRHWRGAVTTPLPLPRPPRSTSRPSLGYPSTWDGGLKKQLPNLADLKKGETDLKDSQTFNLCGLT